jgi:hypothetical protein
MLTIQECKKLLNKNGIKYSDREIEQIRDFLWELAQIGVKNLKKQLADENSSYNEPSKQ